ARQALFTQLLPAFVTEHLRDKILSQSGVIQPALLFHRQIRKVVRQSLGKQSTPSTMQDATAAINLHALEAATRRTSFQNVAAKLLLCDQSHLLLRPVVHTFRMIASGPRSNEMNTLLFVGKTEGLSWNSESYFHFRTQRNPFHKSSKVACEELVFLM